MTYIYLGIIVTAAVDRELVDDQKIPGRPGTVSGSSSRGRSRTGRRGAVAGVGDEEASVGGELPMERNAHERRRPSSEIEDRDVVDAQGASGSPLGHRRDRDLAVLGP